MLTLRDKILLFPVWPVAILPMPVLQVISRFMYILIYYFLGYRKKVVIENLKNSFPEKSQEEIKHITKEFYKHFCDIIIETLHMLKMGGNEVKKRYYIANPEVADDLYASGKDLIVVTSHYGNWEWASSGWIQLPYNTIGVYKPMSNKLFNRFMLYLRSIYGAPVVPMKNTLRTLVEARKNDDRFAVYLIGDQRPMKSEIQHWLNFLNQDTPVITGPEKIAKRFNAAVIFLDIQQKKRGYYSVNLKVISDEPANKPENKVTEQYFRLVEEQIRRKPELYLWSHKRWKIKKEDILQNPNT